jgi:hypothetical protein
MGLLVQAGGSSSDTTFRASTAGGVHLFLVQGNGNVGVGTLAPEGLLEVQGAEGTDSNIILDADDGDDAADTWFLRSTAADNKLRFLNDTNERVTIESGGNVGIGTTVPTSALQVNNTFSYSSMYDNGNSGAAITINWNNGNMQKVTMTGNCTFTFTAPGGISKVMLQLTQDGTGGRTATWPAAVKWPSAVAPTLTSAAGSVDFVSCLYNGTNYYCTASLDFR